MNEQPVCSVIIPSYRSVETIGACLTLLLGQDLELPYEIIVVDSSPDGTPALIRRDFPQVRLIHIPHQTDPALARNIGANQAQGEMLAFIDADCVAAPDWLRRLYTTIQEGYQAAGGAIANHNGETLVSWAGYFCEFREFLPGGSPVEVGNLTLGNAAYRRESFWAVGGFPSGYFPQEDQVFHRLLCQRGMRIRFDPGIVVAHCHRSKLGPFLKHQRCIGLANAQVLKEVDLPGSGLTRRPWLALLAMPALISFRFMRTLLACRSVERGLLWRQPLLIWLCWLGMCWWGWGFLEGVFTRSQAGALSEGHSSAGHASASGAKPASRRMMSPETPFLPISIVVCTHERPDDLERCLEALKPLAEMGHEVIVVDNAPTTSRTADLVAGYPFRYLGESQKGLNNARNCGLQAASQPIVAYTDDDAVPDLNWARAIAQPFVDPTVGCVTGLVLPLELETPAQEQFEIYCRHRRVFERKVFAAPQTPPAAAGVVGMGANMAVRRGLALHLGGFDPRLDGGTATLSGGDTDMFARVLETGAKIVYSPEALVRHRHRREMAELRRCIFGYGVGLYSFLTKRLVEGKDPQALIIAARWFAGPLVKAAWRRVRGQAVVPLDLLLLEAWGACLGPWRFHAARCLAHSGVTNIEATDLSHYEPIYSNAESESDRSLPKTL